MFYFVFADFPNIEVKKPTTIINKNLNKNKGSSSKMDSGGWIFMTIFILTLKYKVMSLEI